MLNVKYNMDFEPCAFEGLVDVILESSRKHEELLGKITYMVRRSKTAYFWYPYIDGKEFRVETAPFVDVVPFMRYSVSRDGDACSWLFWPDFREEWQEFYSAYLSITHDMMDYIGVNSLVDIDKEESRSLDGLLPY